MAHWSEPRDRDEYAPAAVDLDDITAELLILVKPVPPTFCRTCLVEIDSDGFCPSCARIPTARWEAA
jgi:hypothetical protein